MHVTYIERSPGVWRLRIELGRDGDGKRLFSYETVQGTEDDAQRRRFEIVSANEQGSWVEPTKLTVACYLTQWIANRVALGVICRGSSETYGRMLENHVTGRIGGILLQKLVGGEIQALYTSLLSGPHALKPASLLVIHRFLRTAMKEARQARLIVVNPMDEVKPPRNRTARGANRAVEVEAIERLLREVAGDWKEDIVHFALGTGMRRGEICGLQWGDLDLNRGRVRITHQVVQFADGSWERKEPKTDNAVRTVSLPAPIVEMLRARRAAAAAESMRVGGGSIDADYVFTSMGGAKLLPTNLSQAFRQLADKIGLPGFTFHGLRHTHITTLLRDGAPAKAVSERVGHASVAFTMGVYQSVFDEDHDKLAALSAKLFSKRGT